MRFAILVAIVVGNAGCGLGSHDVELTVLTPASVTDAALAGVRTLEVGAGTDGHGGSISYPLSRPFARSERILIHVTSDKGELAVGVIAHDAGGGIVALGTATAHLDGSAAQKVTLSIAPPATGDASIIHLTPPAYTLFVGQAMTMSSDSPVRWSVQEGAAGGTVDAKGRYAAPMTAGTYHVVAASSAYFGHSGVATIDVVTSGVAPYIGAIGGGGYNDGPAGVGRLAQTRGSATDGKKLYFTTQDKLVRAVDLATGELTTIAGVLDQPAPIDGTGRAAHFSDPRGIVVDAIGNLYVADGTSYAVRKIVLATGVVTTLAGTLGMSGYADGAPGVARFSSVTGLAADGAGSLYVTDENNCSVRKIDIASGNVTTIAGAPPPTPQCGNTNGSGTAARFNFPNATMWDGAGHLYIDDGNLSVRKIDVASGAVSTLSSTGGAFYMAWDGHSLWSLNGTLQRVDVDGTVTPIKDLNNRFGGSVTFQFSGPLAFAPDGTLYVFDNETAMKFDIPTTNRTVIAGVHSTSGQMSALADRAQTRLNGLNSFTVAPDGLVYGKSYDFLWKMNPATGEVSAVPGDPYSLGGCCAGMAADAAGNLYGTGYDQTVRRISLSDGTSSIIAGSTNTYGYKNGIGSAAQFNTPGDIALDGAGNAYVADANNTVIRKIVLGTGEVSLFAGTPNSFGYVDGPGASAKFGSFYGLVYDGAGALYVGDTGNNRIRKITVPGAVVTTLAGSGMVGSNDGPSASASFYSPQGLAFDVGKQNLYVTDTLNNMVRKVSVPGGAVSTIAGTVGLSFDQPGTLPAIVNQPNLIGVLPTGDILLQTRREMSILQIRLP